MGCRKNSPGKPCCGSACVDATTLPTSVTFGVSYHAGAIATSDWSNTSPQGVSVPCCWYAKKVFAGNIQPNSGQYEYQCAAPYGFSGIDQILVSIRWKLATYFILSKQTCQCDAQPSPVNQHILYVADEYEIWSAPLLNYGPNCIALAFGLSRNPIPRPANFFALTQVIARKTYFPTAVSATLTLTSSSTASCDDTCAQGGFGLNSVTQTLTLLGVSRSVTWDDSSSWSIGITY